MPIMGFYQTQGQVLLNNQNSISQEDGGMLQPNTAGRIVVYGDSNCLDNSHMQKGLFVLF